MGVFGIATIQIYYNKKLTKEAYNDIISTLCESTCDHFELDYEYYKEKDKEGYMQFIFDGKDPYCWESQCSKLSGSYNLSIEYEYTIEHGESNFYEFKNGKRELTKEEKIKKKIEELETRNKELETRNKELETRNKELEKKLINNKN